MKPVFLFILSAFLLSFTVWQPDIDTAKQVAKEKHQLILLNFSGSDWCAPCIRMKKELFESKTFSAMSDSSLVMVNADFPRSKKHRLTTEQQRGNDLLAEKYNPEGKFPFTLLIDAEGKIIKSWDGLPDQTPEQFTQQVKSICDANK
jgi:thioredoxin-related protein